MFCILLLSFGFDTYSRLICALGMHTVLGCFAVTVIGSDIVMIHKIGQNNINDSYWEKEESV
jgi:hypothetical protein